MSTLEYVRSLGFGNVQDYVNSGPNCTINNERLKGVVNFMLTNGWERVPNPDSYNFGSSDMIKYVTANNAYTRKGGSRIVEYRQEDMEDDDTEMVYGNFGNKFRSGGWFIEKSVGDNGDYILYKPYKKGQPPIPVQLSNIKDLYVLTGEQQKKNKDNKIVYYRRPGEETRYPVKLFDKCGVEVVIAYAKDQYSYDRFLNTKKYERAMKNGWKFK